MGWFNHQLECVEDFLETTENTERCQEICSIAESLRSWVVSSGDLLMIRYFFWHPSWKSTVAKVLKPVLKLIASLLFPSWKPTYPLRIDGWKVIFPFKIWSLFEGRHVEFLIFGGVPLIDSIAWLRSFLWCLRSVKKPLKIVRFCPKRKPECLPTTWMTQEVSKWLVTGL